MASNVVNVAQSRLQETTSNFRKRKQQELATIARIFDRKLRGKVSVR